jgi:ubiquinone/menaquinone biosynthesis C-methylase UbiE/DNA-binding transcriptional ArsR family regulator
VASIVKSLSLIADPTRLRILLLLREDELSVAELQEILSLPQSNISAQLARLRSGGLVEDRRSGKNRLYCLKPAPEADRHARFMAIVEAAGAELQEVKRDHTALTIVKTKRADLAQAYFDALAGRFGRHYIPGRSWKALAETLIKLLPPMVIADLGAGEGTLSQLLAPGAQHVIAVDSSAKMVDYGSALAEQHGFTNLEFRLGDLEQPPIPPSTCDMAILSQALHHAKSPQRAIAAAHTILKPGGRLVVLDLLKHTFEKARTMYADQWLGFSEVDLHEMLSQAGFQQIQTKIVHRETQSPHFQTVLALAVRS